MSHNIAFIDGSWQAVYADQPAWHNLGTVKKGAMTAEQVGKQVPPFRKSIETAPVFAKIGGRMVEVPDRVATHRQGSTTVLGIVSTDYEKLTDMDALRTMQAVITVAGEKNVKASFVSAGLLGKGEKAFASIDLSKIVNTKIKRDPSRHEAFLFGTWAHDGTEACRLGLWCNRVECQNMRNAALAAAASSGLLVSIRHAGDMNAAVEEARKVLGFAEETLKADVALMNALVDIPIAKPKLFLKGYTEYVIPQVEDPKLHERAAKNRDEARDVIAGLFTNSTKMVGVPQSAYRAYQAVAEYGDHHRSLRLGDVDEQIVANRRFRSITEGASADMKERALEYIRQEFMAPALVTAN